MKKISVPLALGVLVWLTWTAWAAPPCYSVRVQGCGRKARVCVNTASNAQAERLALEAFKNAYKCNQPNVTSYSSSCAEAANDPCDLRR